MAAPEKRKPASGKAGSLEVGKAGRCSFPDNAENRLKMQAAFVASRFRLSQQMAAVVAEHAFGMGGVA